MTNKMYDRLSNQSSHKVSGQHTTAAQSGASQWLSRRSKLPKQEEDGRHFKHKGSQLW